MKRTQVKDEFARVGLALLLSVAVAAAGVAQSPEPKEWGPGKPSRHGIGPRATVGPDVFGYNLLDQDEAECAGQFVEISGSGTLIDWGIAGFDDNAVVIPLSASIDFYGTATSSMTMSTNGYLTSDPDDLGTSLGTEGTLCPMPAPLESGFGDRMAPLLDDLVSETSYHQYFAVCPRASDRCRAAEDCTIFLWKGTHHFNDPGNTFDVEAVLYHLTNDLYLHVGPGNPELGAASTSGIQNAPPDGPPYPTATPSSGLTYACDSANSIPDDTGLCVQHPNALPDACVFSDLLMQKFSDAAVREEPGDTVVYTVAVTNLGPDDARNPVVSDDLGPNVTYVSDDCGGSVPSGTTWVWELGSLAASSLAACNITVTVGGARGVLVENTASVTLDNHDPDTSNNTSNTTSFTIGFLSDVSIVKSAMAISGGKAEYELAVGNAGPDQARNVMVADELPAAVQYLSDDCGAGAPAVGNLWEWSVGNLNPAGAATCTITVILRPEPGPFDNTATATLDNEDVNLSNNASTAAIKNPEVFTDGFESGDTSRWGIQSPDG